jgi:hypothetical protein
MPGNLAPCMCPRSWPTPARLRRELARVLDDYAGECESEWNMTRPEFDAHIDALLTPP